MRSAPQGKADHPGLQKRFDRGGDGKIDLIEWEMARLAAIRKVPQEQLREDRQALHILSRTDSRRPFLISAHGRFELVRRYLYLSIGSISGLFLIGAIVISMFTSRFVS